MKIKIEDCDYPFYQQCIRMAERGDPVQLLDRRCIVTSCTAKLPEDRGGQLSSMTVEMMELQPVTIRSPADGS